MPINVFGNSNNSGNKIDTTVFVKKPYLKSNYIESDIEEDIDLKTQFKIKNLPDPTEIFDACNKNYVDAKFNDSTIVKNDVHIDLNDRNITNARFIQVNQLPQIDSHLTAKLYVDNTVNEPTLVRNTQNNNFNDNKLINIDSVTVNRDPILDNELSNKKYIDNELQKNTIVRFNQTLQNYLKVSVGDTIYNLTKYNKIQIIDTTEIKFPNIGTDLLQKWNIKCNNKNYQSIQSDFIKSTKTNSPTNYSGATILPPIGNAFMYIETSSNNHSNYTYVTWERTDIIQITNISFYYNRFTSPDISLRAMGRFKILLLLENNEWVTHYTIDENDYYSNSSSEWKLLNLDFTVENYGIRLAYDRIRTAHADMCFSNIMITHSVY